MRDGKKMSSLVGKIGAPTHASMRVRSLERDPKKIKAGNDQVESRWTGKYREARPTLAMEMRDSFAIYRDFSSLE
jgi:hypothetical protein